ncbi:MAG TPA: LLM class flavin-dependent oxidoreductase [Bacillota bacterium]
MELGVFLPIANNGWIISKTAPQYKPTFELNKETTLKAEALGFDFVFSMVKWRGYGGETEHWDWALESLTLTAGLAAVTSRIQLWASVQPLTVHPAVVAKMGATIDNISQGRFGLNLVAGWAKPEYDQMGLWPGDDFFEYRYEYAEEWLDIVLKLWQYGRLTYEGRWYKLKDCLSYPLPVQRPHPPIVNAGMSERGLRFAVEHSDYSFLAAEIDQVGALVRRGKELARQLGKTYKAYAVFTVVMADTDQRAEEIAQSYIDGADLQALANVFGVADLDKGGSTAERMKSGVFIAPRITGSPDTVADQFEYLESEAGLDGILVTFPDFLQGIDDFGAAVMPRLRAKGLIR